MKRLLNFSVAALLLCPILLGAKKWHKSAERVDPFTGDKTKLMVGIRVSDCKDLGNDQNWMQLDAAHIITNNGSELFYLRPTVIGRNLPRVVSGSTLDLLIDQNPVKLTAELPGQISVYQGVGRGIQEETTFPMTKEQFLMLAKARTVRLRINGGLSVEKCVNDDEFSDLAEIFAL